MKKLWRGYCSNDRIKWNQTWEGEINLLVIINGECREFTLEDIMKKQDSAILKGLIEDLYNLTGELSEVSDSTVKNLKGSECDGIMNLIGKMDLIANRTLKEIKTQRMITSKTAVNRILAERGNLGNPDQSIITPEKNLNITNTEADNKSPGLGETIQRQLIFHDTMTPYLDASHKHALTAYKKGKKINCSFCRNTCQLNDITLCCAKCKTFTCETCGTLGNLEEELRMEEMTIYGNKKTVIWKMGDVYSQRIYIAQDLATHIRWSYKKEDIIELKAAQCLLGLDDDQKNRDSAIKIIAEKTSSKNINFLTFIRIIGKEHLSQKGFIGKKTTQEKKENEEEKNKPIN